MPLWDYDLSVSETWYEERSCPSDVCNGQTRRYKVMTMTTGAGKVIARVERCTLCGYRPGDVKGSSSLRLEANIATAGQVIPTPELVAEQTAGLAEFGFRVVWYRMPDGLYLIQVYDDNETLLDGGGGDDPEEMLLEVAERLLPPE